MPTSQPLQLIDRLAAIPYTGAISDILDEMGHPHQVPAAGRPRDDYFLPFLRMLGALGPGDVVVSQPNDSTIAHFGELSCETAKFRGGRGAVIDGGIRDIDYILKLGFPV